MAPRDPASGRSKALGFYTMLVGTLQLARAVSDPKLSGEVLESGIKNAERLLLTSAQAATAVGSGLAAATLDSRSAMRAASNMPITTAYHARAKAASVSAA